MKRRLAALLVLWPAAAMADPIVVYKLSIPGQHFPSFHVAQRSKWDDADAAARAACEARSGKNGACEKIVKIDARCVSLWQANDREPDGSRPDGIGYGETPDSIKGSAKHSCEIKGPCHEVGTVCSP